MSKSLWMQETSIGPPPPQGWMMSAAGLTPSSPSSSRRWGQLWGGLALSLRAFPADWHELRTDLWWARRSRGGRLPFSCSLDLNVCRVLISPRLHLKCNLMYPRKKYLAGFCRVLDIKKLGLCLIKSKFSLLPALSEITGLPVRAAGGRGNSSWSIMAPWNSPRSAACDY